MESLVCPHCGSQELQKWGFRKYVDGSKARMYHCKKCGFEFVAERRIYTKRKIPTPEKTLMIQNRDGLIVYVVEKRFK